MSRTVNQQSNDAGAARPGPRRARALAEALVEWYRRVARDLPWRRTQDPYAIWVSEVMLQQTRVEVVTGRWAPFLQRFPDVRSLAEADPAEVLAAWAGLGYYRRARQLHAAAQRILEVHGSHLPTDSAALRLLPGFGAYTAGAVSSIAFAERVCAVDGNVERVLSRLLGLEGDPKRAPTAGVIREVATALVAEESPAEVNQGLMELGATVCTPRSPRCGACPWSGACRARASGRPEDFPRTAPRRRSIEVACYAAVVGSPRGLLWRRRPEGEPNAGLWELPTTPWHPGKADVAAAQDALEDLGHGLDRRWRVGDALARARHGITHHRITVVAHRVEDLGTARFDPGSLRLGPPHEAETWGLTAATTKLLGRLPTLL